MSVSVRYSLLWLLGSTSRGREKLLFVLLELYVVKRNHKKQRSFPEFFLVIRIFRIDELHVLAHQNVPGS